MTFGWLFLTPAHSDDPLSLAAQEIQELNQKVSNLNYKTEFESLIDVAESKYDDAVYAKSAMDSATTAYNNAVTAEATALQEKTSAHNNVNTQQPIRDSAYATLQQKQSALNIANINVQIEQANSAGVSEPVYERFNNNQITSEISIKVDNTDNISTTPNGNVYIGTIGGDGTNVVGPALVLQGPTKTADVYFPNNTKEIGFWVFAKNGDATVTVHYSDGTTGSFVVQHNVSSEYPDYIHQEVFTAAAGKNISRITFPVDWDYYGVDTFYYKVAIPSGLNAYLYDCSTNNNEYNESPVLGCNTSPISMGPHPVIDFDFGSGGPAGLSEDYQIKWTGYIKQTYHATPQFRTCSDDGMIVKIGGLTVIDEWFDRGGGCGESNGFYMSSNNWIAIEVWWYENGGGAYGKLEWNIGNGWVTVPNSVLSTVIPPANPNLDPALAAQATAQSEYNQALSTYNSANSTLNTYNQTLTTKTTAYSTAQTNTSNALTAKNNAISTYNQSIIDLNNAIDAAWEYYDEQLAREVAIAIAQAAANAAANQPTPEPSPQPTEEPTPEPSEQPSPEPTEDVNPEPSPEPSPEQTEPVDPTPTPDSETTDEPTPEPSPEPEQTVEPEPEPSPLPSDIDPEPTPEPEPTPVQPSPESSTNPITNDLAALANLTSKDNVVVKLTPEQAAAVANVLVELKPEQKAAVAKDLGIKTEEIALIAAAMKENPILASAVVEFSDRAKSNTNAPMPYTLADATTELQTEALLADPIGALTNIDLDKVLNPSEWGKDMTDDQREKAQEVVIPVIIASNIVAAAMTRRI